MLTASFLTAQSVYEIKASTVTVAGTSSLHDWSSPATQVKAKGSLTVTNGKLTAIPNLTVTIPVRGIKSTKGKVMDNKTYEALKADQHPNITFQLASITSIDAGTVKAKGKLTIAGVTKTVDLSVKYTVLANGDLRFEGTKEVLMSDYNMEAPTALMGTIKTGNAVTVKFNVTMEPAGSLSGSN